MSTGCSTSSAGEPAVPASAPRPAEQEMPTRLGGTPQRRDWPEVRNAALLAGRAVPGRARVPWPSVRAALAAACCTADGRRSPANEKTQRPIAGTFLGALGQGLRMDRAKHRSADRIDNCHHGLGAARRGEHDPVEFRAAGRDSYKLTRVRRVHQSSVPRPAGASFPVCGCSCEAAIAPCARYVPEAVARTTHSAPSAATLATGATRSRARGRTE